jgi:DNA invertase Pin-like site-specific DNA recombinase
MAQDLTAQRQALAALGVPADRVYLDKGLTGTNRVRPGLDQALAAVREGDTLTVTKLDRLARSVPDALDILGQLSARGVRAALVCLGKRRSLAGRVARPLDCPATPGRDIGPSVPGGAELSELGPGAGEVLFGALGALA